MVKTYARCARTISLMLLVITVGVLAAPQSVGQVSDPLFNVQAIDVGASPTSIAINTAPNIANRWRISRCNVFLIGPRTGRSGARTVVVTLVTFSPSRSANSRV